MKIKALLAVAGAAMCLTGCYSLDTVKMKWSGEEHVVSSNYGWSLFNCIPLFCGNASENASCPFVLFRDDVTVDKVQHRFVKYANGRQIVCPTYYCNDTVITHIFGIPIPYVFCYKEISLSGTLK